MTDDLRTAAWSASPTTTPVGRTAARPGKAGPRKAAPQGPMARREQPGGGRGAEISIAVADGLRHRGVGTLLVEHLGSAARSEGIATFTADALSENGTATEVLADHAARLAPLIDRDVHELITAPRCAPLLGTNGRAPYGVTEDRLRRR
ncbi:GNAT family N-acetyltransferase [Streptomyces sp. NPDC096324]|uniref:GNAT family N-acetyltransferase n=1 Tax=Streptomyces sp. NPDC096324 TaxID=3366085 RepID=UPI0037FE301A